LPFPVLPANDRVGWILLKNSLDWSRAATFECPSTSGGIILAFRTGEANQSIAIMLVPEFFNTIGGKPTFEIAMAP
jgi:hypothetical protein